MAEVNYTASTSTAHESEEPSVEIVDPKVNSVSLTFSEEVESIKDDKKADDDDKINRPSGETRVQCCKRITKLLIPMVYENFLRVYNFPIVRFSVETTETARLAGKS